MGIIRFVFVLLLVFYFQCQLLAQVVNIETRRIGESDKKLIGKTELSVDLIKSSSTIFTARNSTQLQYFQDSNIYILLADLNMMQIDTIRYLNNGFMHFRYNHNFPNKWLVAEAFTQVQFNRVQKIQRRFLWGGGTRFNILDKEKIKLFAGTALMYEFELYLDNTFQDKVRMSNYVSLYYKPSATFSIRHTTYYQPQMDDFCYFRLTNETSLEALIVKNLSFNSKFNYFYDSKPAPAVQKVFFSLTNGLIYRF
jgi:hypothetical protein